MKTNKGIDVEKKLSALPEAPSLFDDLSEKERKYNRTMVEIALAIKNERIFRGLTQKQFADFLGVKQAQVSKWESGDHNFTTSTLYYICDKLELELDISIKKPHIGKILYGPKNINWWVNNVEVIGRIAEGA